jgi:hypothetical protein
MTAVGAAMAAAALLVWLGLGSHIPGAGLASSASAFLRRWVDMVSIAMGALCGQGLEAAEAMGLALRAAAPTIGIYVAAEVGILLAVVLVSRSGKRREAVRPLVLV